MGWVLKFFRSSIGAKILVALTGFALFAFVLQHMIANLQIFAGQEAVNSYAHALKSKTWLVWPARCALALAAIIHVVMTVRLRRMNAHARPVKYAVNNTAVASKASRTMILTGLVVLAFVVYHLLHFTLGVTHPQEFHLTDNQGRHDVFTMFVNGFKHIELSVAYIVAMLCLWPHLAHGVSSMFQTLGINHPKYNWLITKLGPAFATLIVVGNIAMPIAVLAGAIHPLGTF